jgi:hypothetical protein
LTLHITDAILLPISINTAVGADDPTTKAMKRPFRWPSEGAFCVEAGKQVLAESTDSCQWIVCIQPATLSAKTELNDFSTAAGDPETARFPDSPDRSLCSFQ